MQKYFIFIIALCTALLTSCDSSNQQAAAQTAVIDNTETQAYYFHLTRRCITCQTVEKIAAETFDKEKLPFESINLEDESSKDLAAQLGVTGQTLLLVKGDKKIDLTNSGFLNARNNPEQFINDIKKAICDIQS